MKDKPGVKIYDEDGTSMEATLERDGRMRFITNADKVPQGNGVWLDRKQVADLICDLAGLWVQMVKEEIDASPADPS